MLSRRARYAAAYHHAVSTYQRAGATILSAGAGCALVGTFMTWVRSGAAKRSSYDVFDLVERLGFSSGGVVGWALRLWPLVPLLLVATVVCWWWPARSGAWTAARLTFSAISVLYAGGTALAVATVREVGLLTIGAGPAVTVVGAGLVAAGSAIAMLPDSGA